MKLRNMNKYCVVGILVPLMGAATAAAADWPVPEGGLKPVVVTSSNAATSATANQLLVYDSSGNLLQTVSTGGKGGVSGNAGGIEALGGTVAVVNYGSQNVSIFDRDFDGFHMQQLVAAASSPVSVAFGNGHLYILGTTKVESHPMYGLFGSEVSSSADGTASLLFGDGSAAQVGVLPGQLIVTEKGGTKNNTYGTIETVGLTAGGAVTGVATAVQNIPANPNAPFGLVTRGDDAYVTIAHSNEIALVRDGKVLTVTGSGTQNAPCWLALEGPFLFSSNSPSMSVSRYAVYGQKIVQDAAVAAGLSGDPTDIATAGGLVAVIDGSGHLSIFTVDEDGNLTLVKAAAIGAASNGVSVVSGGGFLP